MPRNVISLRIFVSSPRDVADERDRLERVVNQLNANIALDNGLHLELIRWEKKCHPGVGRTGQAVVNSQIGTYDLFVGILWNRLGTPTGDAESGTREEFDCAYAQWRRNKSSLEIWFYFNEQPFNPKSHEELTQKGKVLDFRQELENDKGLLTWTYNGSANFEEQIRSHLEAFIRKYMSQSRPPSDSPDSIAVCEDEEMVNIPVLGKVGAGDAIQLLDPSSVPLQPLWLPRQLVPNPSNLFAVLVDGNSMILSGINDGDVVLMQHQNTVLDGEIAVVLLKGEEGVLLKRLYRDQEITWLESANPLYQSLPANTNDLEILGKAFAVVPQRQISPGLVADTLIHLQRRAANYTNDAAGRGHGQQRGKLGHRNNRSRRSNEKHTGWTD